MEIKVGDILFVMEIVEDPSCVDVKGTVTSIDEEGLIFGTWGKCPINPVNDRFKIVSRA